MYQIIESPISLDEQGMSIFEIVYNCMDTLNRDKITVSAHRNEPSEPIVFTYDILCKSTSERKREFDPNVLVLFGIAVFVNWVAFRRVPKLDLIENLPQE